MTEPRDRARPIPQRSPSPVSQPDEDVYVVDTRGRAPRESPRPRRSPNDTRGYAGEPAPGIPPAGRGAPGERPLRPGQQRVPTGAGQPRQAPRPSSAPPRARGQGQQQRVTERSSTPPPPRPGPPARKPRRGGGGRRLVRVLLAIVVVWIAFLAWVPFHAWNSVSKVDSTPAGARPEAGGGSNYLLVGSDSRAGMSEAEQQELSTGPDEGGGQRTDSIILVHRSSSGQSSMVSIPRDSYVEVPGHGRNKINAAFAIGGPKLLVQTVELATGLRIEGYLEIGFGGFAKVVDSLDGVEVCVPFDMNDERAGITLKAGCQTLNGPNALGYVRARYSDPRGDIGRAERQRQFLSAIIKKAATPSTVLIPWRYYGFAMASASGLRAGEDTSLLEAVSVVRTMRDISGGQGLSMVVPVSDPGLQTNAGMAVKWDTAKATALFDALKADTALTEPMPGTDGVPTGQ
ncbi:MAG TPA: LCP family protein [Phycicoccus sp.]|nr:LCP family protein [Phycicoccus sp.]HQK32700.1 LCP family protein [Phycicoccus sp.]